MVKYSKLFVEEIFENKSLKYKERWSSSIIAQPNNSFKHDESKNICQPESRSTEAPYLKLKV